MRMALTVAVAALGVAVSPPATADPASTCPPACNRIPDSAWVSPAAIPMDARYEWPELAGLAVTSRTPRFRFEELCASRALPQDPRGYSVAERSVVSSPDGQWQLQVQILHWRGETWWGGQLAKDAVTAAVSALRDCQLTNPGASPSLTLADPDRAAAVISGPVVLHEYLLADPVSSTVAELALWSAAPVQTPYPTVDDEGVFDALAAPLCTAYIDSCP